MQLSSLVDVFALAFSNPVNSLFSCVMVFIFTVSVLNTIGIGVFRAKWALHLAESAPGLLPTLGILGTFVGICIGLLSFKTSSIEQSVPLLLEGLKTSFVTSVVGVFLAVVLKFTVAVIGKPAEQATTVEDAVIQMAGSLNTVAAFQADMAETLTRIRSSIASDDDTSLVTQIQKLRTESKDGNDVLVKEFRDFAKAMAENNSKALVQALEKVIRDFNAQLNEQFGENFKELNKAVGALQMWQENYRDQVDQWLTTAQAELKLLREFIEASEKSLQGTEKSVHSIAISTGKIPPTMESLEALIGKLDYERQQITLGLAGLTKIREDASAAIPDIQGRLNNLVQSFSNGVDATVSSLQKGIDRQEQGIRTQAKQLDEMNRQSRETFERTIRETSDLLKKQVKNLDDALQAEITRTIDVMGSHLASLSNKFVQDYGPLTDKLRRVVELANGHRQ